MKANDGWDLVYRPQGKFTTHKPANVVVACLSTVGTGSHEGAGVVHRIEGDLDGLHYQHIMQNVTVPSERMPYPDGIIHLQQEDSSILDSRVVQERVEWQDDVEILDWLPRAPDMNPIENMWGEVKRTMQETWPVLPPTNSDELWTLMSDAWDEVHSSMCYIHLND